MQAVGTWPDLAMLGKMAAWSTFARSASQNFAKSRLLSPVFTLNNVAINAAQTRTMSNTMHITASRWQWHRCKDLLHLYFLVGAIPLGIITFCANVFVGPATLKPIPEGYEPKYWEYERNPVTRFLARYVYSNPQKDYEKFMATVYNEQEVMKVRALEKKVWALQAERLDYKYNYFLPYNSYPVREFRELLKRDRDDMSE